MSRLTDRLRAVGIINQWDMVRDGFPGIAYVGADHGRGGHGAYWHVWIKGRSIRGGAWYEYGGRHIVVRSKAERMTALEEALALVSKLCPGVEMVKGPWPMTYVPKADLRAAMARLKEHAAQEKVGK